MPAPDVLTELGLRRWTRRAGVFPENETEGVAETATPYADEPAVDAAVAGPVPVPVPTPAPTRPPAPVRIAIPAEPAPPAYAQAAAPASSPGLVRGVGTPLLPADDLFPAPGPTPLPPVAWEDLPAAAETCTRCKLCATRTHAVFGEGPAGVATAAAGEHDHRVPLLVVGEGPGADEDASGRPFVGRAGKLLDEMLQAIGHGREVNTYIANVVKCRPPGNRDPEADEVEACRPYLDRQIAHLRPRLIVALGRVAAQRLLSTAEPLSRLRGATFHYGEARTPVFVTYHPAYLLRTPRDKAKSWQDLKRVWNLLGTGAVAQDPAAALPPADA